MDVLDHLNAKDGKGTLYFAGWGMPQPWAMKREMLSPRHTTRYEDLLQVKWQVYPDFHIPDVMEPQPHRMQERAAASWRSFDSASIEWLPVAADFTCSG
ncbi:DUF4113 domain-containing protein [Salmonella enterica]|nr:DUF4113 domain-containing protein [Salmonella enterica]EBN8783841.1 DUF4113 domain-containing protein [Salmonella enterica]ECK5520519.1 DUF4113 domain-containing protein [Salmonella enterica]ECL5715125.1 DUF4113 domain-containing protein [Salmonella enterica]ECR8419569.1 DUF4113 domain-containing protein [Salmonella enterica]